jgi:hypothetical protein
VFSHHIQATQAGPKVAASTRCRRSWSDRFSQSSTDTLKQCQAAIKHPKYGPSGHRGPPVIKIQANKLWQPWLKSAGTNGHVWTARMDVPAGSGSRPAEMPATTPVSCSSSPAHGRTDTTSRRCTNIVRGVQHEGSDGVLSRCPLRVHFPTQSAMR